jgi:hypothetical protein
MEKLTENMIRWAESKLGSTEYAGCRSKGASAFLLQLNAK